MRLLSSPTLSSQPRLAELASPQTRMEDGKAEEEKTEATRRRLSCTKCFDTLWFCYSPFHQMQQYYRHGEFDTCFAKWSSLYDCLNLKTKSLSQIEEILEEREKAKTHIWTHRTVEEASENWWRMYNHFVNVPPPEPDS
ncbi:hypothetical protein LUZ60_010512 [Juncus effusus]|nr:hypothetical protein LUZ60_010512 [Juncus effusus]